jgi:predicted Zn finger-like uncharacterized protein
MIISCPSCSARYVVNIDDIGHGRQVKCTRCNHSWYFENKTYEAEKKLLINEISNEKIIRESLSDQNLPVVYKKQKNIPLPFLVLIVPVIFIFGNMIIDSIEIDAFAVSQSINNFISLLVNQITELFNN